MKPGPTPLVEKEFAAPALVRRRFLTLPNLCAAAVLSCAILLSFLPASRLQSQRFALELQISSNVPGRVQVYFGDGSGFTEALSARAPIDASDQAMTVRLPLPPGTWLELRLDPLEGPGRAVISEPRIVSQDGETIRPLPLESLTSIRHIATMERREQMIEVSSPPGSNDPQVRVALDPPLEIPWPWRQLVIRFWLPVLGVFGVLVAVLVVLDRIGPKRPRVSSGVGRAWRLGVTATFFLVILGARLAVIDRFGTDLPFWDQWWREGMQTLVPWSERGEFWRSILLPHNEHRVAPTLALNLALAQAGGQWDARVQCIVNAALAALLVAVLLPPAWRRLPSGWVLGLGALASLLIGSPLAWENIVGGFQSQFYFLIGFSLAAMGGILGWPAFSRKWWGALGLGALALVSMGSGFFWALPVVAIALLRGARGEIGRREAALLLAAAGALAAAGLWLRSNPDAHDFLHARSAGEFLRYAVKCLAWPVPQFPAFAALAWAPWTALLVLRLIGKPGLDRPLADFILAVGGWVLLHAGAAAYARGVSGAMPASRYSDVFALGPLAGFAALAAMAEWWRGARIAAVPFAGLVAAAVAVNTNDALTGFLPERRADYAAYERSVQDFVLGGDYATFARRPLPFPSADELALVLRKPAIRAILPASVRAPLRIPGFEQARPPEPAIDHRGTRFVAGPARWQSAPVPPGQGWWKIETSGAIGQPGALLELVAPAGNRVLARIAPTKAPGESWRAAYVRAPSEPAVFVARSESAARWLAFSEPIELPPLSYWSWRIAKHGLLILCLATIAAMTLVILQPLGVCRDCTRTR